MASSTFSRPELDLAAKVDALKRSETYPDNPTRIETIETHLSWVFLTEDYAFKLKKPVRYNAADFRTLDARLADCREEVRLNRRLAESVYLGVVPLVQSPAGTLRLGADGHVIDWLIKMHRLPADRMLDTCIQSGSVSVDELRGVASKLARFYAAGPPIVLSGPDYLRRLKQEIRTNAAELSQGRHELPIALVDDICAAQVAFVSQAAELLSSRATNGRIVDGHGDLRPAHICLISPPVIFDCLEFDPQLRIVDAVDELSFLALECERLGAPDIGSILFDVYADVTGDAPPPVLVSFYTSWRATTWARLAVFRAREPGADRVKWLTRARDYLKRAQTSVGRLNHQACTSSGGEVNPTYYSAKSSGREQLHE